MNWLQKISKRAENKVIFHADIETDTLENTDFRRVLFTTKHSQLVLMSIQPGEDIGEEIHGVDQFFRFEAGVGKVVAGGKTQPIKDGDSITIPSGTKHNIINTGDEPLKLYSIYSPPNHKAGTVHKTKADVTEEQFDGLVDA